MSSASSGPSQKPKAAAPEKEINIHKLFEEAFSSTDPVTDALPLSLQADFVASFMQHFNHSSAKRKRKEDDSTQKPRAKQQCRESNTPKESNTMAPQSSHDRLQDYDEGMNRVATHTTKEILSEQDQQRETLMVWFAQQLRNAERGIHHHFQAQQEAHRLEIEALKSKDANATQMWATKITELQKQILTQNAPYFKVDEVDKSRFDRALENHNSVRKKLLRIVSEEHGKDKVVMEQMKQEQQAYNLFEDVIATQIKLQECNHFNLQSRFKSTIEEQKLELNRLEECLAQKSHELEALKVRFQKKVDSSTASELRRKQAKHEALNRLVNKMQNENEKLKKQMEGLKKSRIASMSSQHQDPKKSNDAQVEQKLHQVELENTRLKEQLQATISSSTETLANANNVSKQVSIVREQMKKQHEKELKMIVLRNLGNENGFAHRMEQMALTIKNLNAINRELAEKSRKQEEILQKVTKERGVLSCKKG